MAFDLVCYYEDGSVTNDNKKIRTLPTNTGIEDFAQLDNTDPRAAIRRAVDRSRTKGEGERS